MANTPPPDWIHSLMKANSEAKPANTLSDWLANLSFEKIGQYFLNQTVYIDDYTFNKCRFDNCRLITFKGTFKFKHCVIDASTVIQYGGEAYKIATLFNVTTLNRRLYPNFEVKMNEDGTFSLE